MKRHIQIQKSNTHQSTQLHHSRRHTSDERLLLTMYPAELNSLSQGTDVAGTQRTSFASRANVGKRCSLLRHPRSEFSPSGNFFSALKRANSSPVLSSGSSRSESESVSRRRLFLGLQTVSESPSVWLTGSCLVWACPCKIWWFYVKPLRNMSRSLRDAQIMTADAVHHIR